MDVKKKQVNIIISTNSETHVGDGALEHIILGSSLAMPELLDDDIDGELVPVPAPSEDDEDELFSEPPKGGAGVGAPDNGRMVVSVLGELSCDGGVTCLRYSESELTNMGNSVTFLSFREPGEITMVREGNARTTLCFNDKKQRRICCYNNSFFPVEVAVITERFKNELTFERGGRIDVKYTVELKGIPVENTRIRISVKPI